MSKEEKLVLGVDFCREIAKGRQATKMYFHLVLEFGDIYSTIPIRKGTGLKNLIAKGNNVSDLITPNMEALMRTIIMMGCAKDWPTYLNSSEYKKWHDKHHGLSKETYEEKTTETKKQRTSKRNKTRTGRCSPIQKKPTIKKFTLPTMKKQTMHKPVSEVPHAIDEQLPLTTNHDSNLTRNVSSHTLDQTANLTVLYWGTAGMMME